MTILVTGATGNVGRQVVEQLVKRGADVRALVRDPAKANFPAGVTVVQGDLLDVDSLRERVLRCLHPVPAQRRGAGRIHPGADRAEPCPRGRHRADRLPVGDPQRPLRERAALRGQVRRRAHDRADGLQRHHPAPGLLHEQRSHDQGRGDRIRRLPDADRQQGTRDDRRARHRRDRGHRADPPRTVRHAASARPDQSRRSRHADRRGCRRHLVGGAGPPDRLSRRRHRRRSRRTSGSSCRAGWPSTCG